MTLDARQSGTRHAGGVIVIDQTSEHTGLAAAQTAGVDTRAVDRLPRCFQHQTLLRIGGQRLPRAYLKEAGVEHGSVMEEAPFADITGAAMVWIWMVQAREIPATICGKTRYSVAARAHQLPQILRRLHAARETTGNPYDRNWLTLALPDISEFATRGLKIDRDVSQVLKGLVLGCHDVHRLSISPKLSRQIMRAQPVSR